MGHDLEFSTELIFPEDSEANDYIPRLWASRKLGHLERQIWTEGMSDKLTEEIRSLALRYGLPSRYTSYLVQEPDVVVANRPGPLDAMSGGSGGGRTSHARSKVLGNAPAAAPTTGATAVQAAESARRMRGAASQADLQRAEDEILQEVFADLDDGTGTRAVVGGRVFELRDDVWTDLAWDEDARVVEIALYSSAWFAVIGAIPEIESILRSHENVVIAGEELSLKVGSDGSTTLTPEELRGVASDFRGVTAG